MNLKKYKYAEITRHINYNLIPVNTFLMNTDGIKEFNTILKEIKQQQYNSIIIHVFFCKIKKIFQ